MVDIAPPQRFVVYLQENGSSFKPNIRLSVNTFRRQSKSMGSCSMRLLASSVFTGTQPSLVADPRPSQRFVIIDSLGLTILPESIDSFSEAPVLFYGRIRNIVLDKFQNTADYMGEVSGDEEGWFYYQEAMFSCQDIPFNAVTDKFYLGNKQKDVLLFEKYNPRKLKESDVAELGWTLADADYVWSLEEAIDYIGTIANIEFIMPWDVDDDRISANNSAIEVPPGETLESQPNYVSSAGNKDKYKIFLDKIKPKSYSSPYGKSPVEWLDENLLDNFTYRFYYTSSGFVTCAIINKSLVDTELFPKAILPVNVEVNGRATNVSVTSIGETYTQVEVVSSRILFAGTLTTKNIATQQKTIDRNWEYTDEENFAWGNDSKTDVSNPKIYRNSFKNQKAYTNFKFIKNVDTDCPIMVSKPMDFDNEFAARTLTPFFPFIGVNETTGTLTISTSFNSHQSPDTANIKWADYLPYGYSDATSKYQLFEPFVSLTVTTEKAPNEKSIIHLQGSAEKPTLEIGDDIKIKQPNPQSLGYIKNDAFLFKIGGVEFPPSQSATPSAGGSYDWGNGASDSMPDPDATSLGDYPNFSHWSMIYLTVAGYSAQRLSLYKVKDNPGISTRRKVIEADDCEYWIAHPGAFKPTVQISSAATAQGYGYVPEVVANTTKVIRNDYKKQKSYLDMYSAFLFLDKKSVAIDYTLDGWTNTFEIGQPIGSIKDKQTITTNSVVESIEYFIEGNTPRIRVSTLIPELPPLKKFGEQIRIEGGQPQLSPMSKYKEPSVSTSKEDKRTTITTIQGQGGGGGGAAAPVVPHEVLQPLFGQIVAGVNCIKHTGVVPTSVPISGYDVFATSFPTGIGSAYLWSNGVRSTDPVMVLNDNPIYPHLLMQGATITTYQTIAISGAGSNPPVYFDFYLPFGS